MLEFEVTSWPAGTYFSLGTESDLLAKFGWV